MLVAMGRYAAEIEVPDEAHTILIGMALAGNGAAWFGDLKLESVSGDWQKSHADRGTAAHSSG